MKQIYFLFVVILSFTSCKSEKEQSKEIPFQETLTTPEEDQKRLDDKLAHTERVWDSLSNILQRKDLNEKYRDSVKKLYVENKNRHSEINKDFVKENPNSKISVNLLNGFKFKWGKETTKKLYNSLKPELQNSESGEKIKRYLTFYNIPQLNDQYKDFELTDLKGEPIKISDYRENYTLLEFWASWCISCRKKHPQLVELYEKYKNKGFTVIGISGDQNESDWKTAVEKDRLSWINLIDTEGRESLVQYQYGITMLPSNFLISPDGKIVAIDITPEQLEEVLQEILNKLLTTAVNEQIAADL